MPDPGVSPTAAPPITIGPFANVPAPGSPIRSDWPQQVTQYAVDATARQLAEYKHQLANLAGAGISTTPTVITQMTLTTKSYARFGWVTLGQLVSISGSATAFDFSIDAGGGASTGIVRRNRIFANGTNVTMVMTLPVWVTAGANGAYIRGLIAATGASAVCTSQGGDDLNFLTTLLYGATTLSTMP